MTAASAWDAAGIALKSMDYAATLAPAGAVLFLTCCHRQVAPREYHAIRRWVRIGWGACLAAGLLRTAVTAGSLGGEPAAMWSGDLLAMAWQGGLGIALALRAAGLGWAALTLAPRPGIVTAAAAALAPMSFALSGHARALGHPALPIALQCLHLLGVAFWVGSLAPLALIARGNDTGRTAAAATRFSAVAGVAVAILLTAGALLLWMLLGRWSALLGSSYGRMVLVKLCAVSLLLGLAALNKWRLTVRLAAGDAAAAEALRRSIGLEMAIAAVVLIVTAALTTLSGPPAEDAVLYNRCVR